MIGPGMADETTGLQIRYIKVVEDFVENLVEMENYQRKEINYVQMETAGCGKNEVSLEKPKPQGFCGIYVVDYGAG